MRTFANVALGAAMLIGTTASADAQRYYMREKLMVGANASAITYTPVYGSFSACSNGSQTASLVSCTGSDSKTYPSAACGPATKTQSCSPKAVCTLPVVNYWDGPRGPQYVAHTKSGVNSAADALTHCNEQGAIYGKAGACLWDAQAKIAYYNETATVISYSNSVLYASACTVQ
jgi:hypothetical protein